MSAQSQQAKVRNTRSSRAGAPATNAARISTGDAYQLSRVQAEGWNAAHRIGASTLESLDAPQIESLNPYACDPERTRWSTGFTSALAPARGGTDHFAVGKSTTMRNGPSRN